MLVTDKQIESLRSKGSQVLTEAGDDYLAGSKVAAAVVVKPEVKAHVKEAKAADTVALEALTSKFEKLASAIKTAVAERPTIHVEPAKVTVENKPKNWLFTVSAHQPGEEYKVKAEAIEVL